MVISGERIREIAARELERHVHDPDFRSVLKELVQQVEDAIRDNELWILEVVKHLEEIQIIEQDRLYGERADLLRDQSQRLKKEHAKHDGLLSRAKSQSDKARAAQQAKKEHESTLERIRDERRQFDEQMLSELEGSVKCQQNMLVDAQIAGFKVTTETSAINLQRDILRFLLAVHSEVKR